MSEIILRPDTDTYTIKSNELDNVVDVTISIPSYIKEMRLSLPKLCEKEIPIYIKKTTDYVGAEVTYK